MHEEMLVTDRLQYGIEKLGRESQSRSLFFGPARYSELR